MADPARRRYFADAPLWLSVQPSDGVPAEQARQTQALASTMLISRVSDVSSYWLHVIRPWNHPVATFAFIAMRRVIYISRSRIGDDPDELDAIVDSSSASNIVAGITGMLWWDGNNFAQVLEGPHEAVDRAMQRILADIRHTDIAVVFDRAVAGRMFGEWGMRQSDDSVGCTANTVFLIGLAKNDSSSPARRLYDMMLACAA